MADPTRVALAFALGGVGAGLSAKSAADRNKAIRKSQKATIRAGSVKAQQLADRAELERRKRINETQRIIGAIQVASGTSEGGSFETLQRQADFDSALNLQIININERNELENVQSGIDANVLNLQQGAQNVMLQGFQGFIQGAQAGLAIGGGLQPASGTSPANQPHFAPEFGGL